MTGLGMTGLGMTGLGMTGLGRWYVNRIIPAIRAKLQMN